MRNEAKQILKRAQQDLWETFIIAAIERVSVDRLWYTKWQNPEQLY